MRQMLIKSTEKYQRLNFRFESSGHVQTKFEAAIYLFFPRHAITRGFPEHFRVMSSL
jgi:hypothetical protein